MLPLHHGPRSTQEPPAGVEPAPRPYKGRVLPLTLRRPDEWRRRESNPLLLGASEVLRHQSFVPERGRGGPRCGEVRAGGVEPPQLEAPGLQPGELAGCSAPAWRGDRPGSNRRRGDHSPGCFLLHHGHHGWALLVAPCRLRAATRDGDDRTRTGGLSPDKRALCSSELRPQGRVCKRCLDLCGFAAVETSLAGRSRTCGLRLPKPAGWPAPLQPDGRAGLDLAASPPASL